MGKGDLSPVVVFQREIRNGHLC
ncbi:uncharacterized protein G2W53_018457 [Senna tora]|uniref:Uncharacterized protein n=1 Tax=Senna tora TaxID=362788 RepID=A0A834TRU7_9FABA|nr:uncharacterized protein G2W53_018457 [Senna tora]